MIIISEKLLNYKNNDKGQTLVVTAFSFESLFIAYTRFYAKWRTNQTSENTAISTIWTLA